MRYHTSIAAACLTALAPNAPSYAEIIHFTNPEVGQPGHYAWQFDWQMGSSWLDITLSAQNQTNTPNTNSISQIVAAWGNIHSDVPGAPDERALVLGELGGFPMTVALAFGDPVQPTDQIAFHEWTGHVGAGEISNIPVGEHVYIGVLTGSANHGWVEVSRIGMSLTAHAWAYESAAGVAISAGQIPGPGAMMVMTIAAALNGRGKRRGG